MTVSSMVRPAELELDLAEQVVLEEDVVVKDLDLEQTLAVWARAYGRTIPR